MALDIDRVSLEGTRYTHMEQLLGRLSFLEYVLLHSDVELSTDDGESHTLYVWCVVGVWRSIPMQV